MLRPSLTFQTGKSEDAHPRGVSRPQRNRRSHPLLGARQMGETSRGETWGRLTRSTFLCTAYVGATADDARLHQGPCPVLRRLLTVEAVSPVCAHP